MDADAFMITAHEYEGFMMPVPFPTLPVPGFGNDKKIQPEEVFYFPKVWEMKANFEFEENWDVNAIPIDKQKLDEIKKQKPEETKKVQDRNKERARKLGR